MPSALRTQTLTTTEGAVLALLATEGERSAYDLSKLVERAIGHVWSPARSGLFATLPRLAKAGLTELRVDGKKQLHRITPTGEDALRAWLEQVEPGARDTFFLKLFVGKLTTSDVLLEHVAQFRADTEGRLALYREIEPTNTNRGHDWYHRHLLVHAIRRAELDLDWAAEVDGALREAPR